MSKKTHIKVGSGKNEERFSIEYLKTITQEYFVRVHAHSDTNRLINVWKQANGLSKPNRKKD
tara:strand:- start:1467 stop:1652 length:186 start_codon:yes stop_codon:yes gene_type:complete